MKKIILILVVVVGLAGFYFYNSSSEKVIEEIEEDFSFQMHNYEFEGEIDDLTINFLYDALQDEYHAEKVYAKVLSDFGDVRPFVNIINAEVKHSDAIKSVLNTYNLDIPENEWENKEIESFNSLTEACEVGVEAEIANVALYDSFLDKIENEDIKMVLTNLRDASEYKHLPAFERCANR